MRATQVEGGALLAREMSSGAPGVAVLAAAGGTSWPALDGPMSTVVAARVSVMVGTAAVAPLLTCITFVLVDRECSEVRSAWGVMS